MEQNITGTKKPSTKTFRIPCDNPEELLKSLPKGIEGVVKKGKLIITVKLWPHDMAEEAIEWFGIQGISNSWANGRL